MLRTTANALWGRFVPAARQQLTGAGAASVSRVRETPRRRARRRFAGERTPGISGPSLVRLAFQGKTPHR
jgi:hypothetical protein